MSQNIFVTSDLHFCHDRDFLYKPRGFNNIFDHDEKIVENWNEIVKPNDLVYILGDLMLKNNQLGLEYINRLNGFKYIILGNHDTDARQGLYLNYIHNLVDITYAFIIQEHKYQFYLSHYPTKVGNYDDEITHKKFYSLCGHTHTQDKWLDFIDCKTYHVELDAHNNYPVNIETIIEDIRNY